MRSDLAGEFPEVAKISRDFQTIPSVPIFAAFHPEISRAGFHWG